MSELTVGGGLNNLGNTCFFNAALQSILHTPILARIFKKQQHSKSCQFKSKNQWCVFCEMQAKSFSPNSMINHLKLIFKKFKLGRQEDSHEFLRYLIQGMQESETGKLGKERQQNEAKIKKSLIFKSFGGIVKTQVFCLNCKHKSITSQRYYDFNIGKECQSSNTLNDGISKYFAVDKLENNNKYYCDSCKTKSNATKRFLLERSPQTLTFQFKRFTNSMRKIGKFIQYPLTLDLGKYLQEPHKVLMKLYAIIVHAGGSSYSGHYYAFVRVNQNWYKMDDSYVSKCSLESIMNQNAYILFYEKVFQEQVIVQKPVVQKPQDIPKQIKIKPSQLILSKHTNGVFKNNPHSVIETTVKPLVLKNQQVKISEGKSILEIKVLRDLKKQQKQKVIEEQLVEEEEQDEDLSEQLNVPLLLTKKKSKGQLQKAMSPQQLKKKALNMIKSLQIKIEKPRPRNFTQRNVFDLRKYEIAMQKKRKISS